LSNNQTRGAWGERIIEDLLEANGLVEGIHYERQHQMAGGSQRPDIILKLPNKRIVPVDVKFPYAEISKMVAAESRTERETHKKQFRQDLKIKIDKVAEYIDPENNTLDYAILFVPNEMVFSYVNKQFSDLIDEAMSKRVIIVSPFTFLIVARTVMESYRNFMLEDRLRDVIKSIDSFAKEWVRFKDQFVKYGRAIETLQKAYIDLTGTRFRQMDKKIERVEQSQQGNLLAAEIEK